MFLDRLIKDNDFSKKAKDQRINMSDGKSYTLRQDIISSELQKISSNKSNLFGYFVEWNAFRGITMALTEGIKGNEDFNKFLENKLKSKYESFVNIISFIRNTFSHNIDNNITLKKKTTKGHLKES